MIFLRICPSPALGAASLPLVMRAQQRERKLAREKLVIGKPRPGRAFRADVARLGRPVHGAQRIGE